ncbi:membrane protein [Bartonella queenslandensis]|uniref:membrane protein n=1 Tax=Bartonella queenslandensis TaxID=481138 RepID=UPI0005852AB0|nr:membrane protein [Bartonella queenslandensis]
MKEKNMIDFKTYRNVSTHRCKKKKFKKFCRSIKEFAFIGGLNGSISGAIAATLATYGYIALPGLGPIIAMGLGVALSAGMIIGALIGSGMGGSVGICCIVWEIYMNHNSPLSYKFHNE